MVDQALPALSAVLSKTAKHLSRQGQPEKAKPHDWRSPRKVVHGFDVDEPSPPLPASSCPHPLPKSRLGLSCCKAAASSAKVGKLSLSLAQQPATVKPAYLPGLRRVGGPVTAASQLPHTSTQVPTNLPPATRAEAVEDTRDVAAPSVPPTSGNTQRRQLPTSYVADSDGDATPPNCNSGLLATPRASRALPPPHHHSRKAGGLSDPPLPTSPAAKSPSRPATSQPSAAHSACHQQSDTCTAPCDRLPGGRHMLASDPPASSPTGAQHAAADSAAAPADVASSWLASADEGMQLQPSCKDLNQVVAASEAGPPSPLTPIRHDNVAAASPTPSDSPSLTAPTPQHNAPLRRNMHTTPGSPASSSCQVQSPSPTTPYRRTSFLTTVTPPPKLAPAPRPATPTPLIRGIPCGEAGFPPVYRYVQDPPTPPPTEELVDAYHAHWAHSRGPPLLDGGRPLFVEHLDVYKSLNKASLEALYLLWTPYRLPDGSYQGLNFMRALIDICNARKEQRLASGRRHGRAPDARKHPDLRTQWWCGRHEAGFANALCARAPSASGDDATAACTRSAAGRALRSVAGAARWLFGR